MRIGDTVTWTSQSQGIEKEKSGIIIAFIKRNEFAYALLPKGTKKSHIKFSSRSLSDRVLVEVKAGKNNDINHYYAPLKRELERQGN